MRTIGIVGTQPRIGTTTQALQIVQCLRELEYSTGYVEMGNQGYINRLQELYEDIRIEKHGLYVYRDIPLHENVLEANRLGYDYLIKDYGCVTAPKYQELSYLEQDVKIIVGGVKANEIEWVERLMEDIRYIDATYILNFVSQEEQQEVKDLMGEFKQNTYFSLYTPDPFSYVENEAYAYILGE